MAIRQWSLGPHSSRPFNARTVSESAIDSEANTKSNCRWSGLLARPLAFCRDIVLAWVATVRELDGDVVEGSGEGEHSSRSPRGLLVVSEGGLERPPPPLPCPCRS